MSKIVLPESKKQPKKETKLKYQADEADEEKFFLMYHCNWAPSEVDALSEDRRRWIISRFIGQKNMEKEAMQQMRLAQQLGDMKGPPDLRVT